MFLTWKQAPEFSQTFPTFGDCTNRALQEYFALIRPKRLSRCWRQVIHLQQNRKTGELIQQITVHLSCCSTAKFWKLTDPVTNLFSEKELHCLASTPYNCLPSWNSSCIVPFLHQILVTNCHSSFMVTFSWFVRGYCTSIKNIKYWLSSVKLYQGWQTPLYLWPCLIDFYGGIILLQTILCTDRVKMY